jgi:hypothetical protein
VASVLLGQEELLSALQEASVPYLDVMDKDKYLLNSKYTTDILFKFFFLSILTDSMEFG